ncbi:MAG: hypothetical protein R3Y11_07035 [Pseudomonadota bacterium]
MTSEQGDTQSQSIKREFIWGLRIEKILDKLIFLGFLYWCYSTTLDSLAYVLRYSSPDQIRAVGEAIATVLPFNPLPWVISAVCFVSWFLGRLEKVHQNKRFGERREKKEKNDVPKRTSSGLTREGKTPKGVNYD